MNELDERDLDALGDLIDEMFVENKHPREIMTLLMEHESQWNDILIRTLRFARIYQLDFISKCTDTQIRVIARHVQSHTVVTDLCVWQVLQSGLPAYIKNLFRREVGDKDKTDHPWHGGMSQFLDNFELYMSRCPKVPKLNREHLAPDFLETTLWLTRIFQDDVFFAQDADCCKDMLEVAFEFQPEIAVPFLGQLMERGRAKLKTYVWMMAAKRYIRWGSGWNRRTSRGVVEIVEEQVRLSVAKYRRLFYGCLWMDDLVVSLSLEGSEVLSRRIPDALSYSGKTRPRSAEAKLEKELLSCATYEEFELKRVMMGVPISARLLAGLTGESPKCRILAGLLKDHLIETTTDGELAALVRQMVFRARDVKDLSVFLKTVEDLRPGWICGLRDVYGGNLLYYLPRGLFTGLPIPFDGGNDRYKMLLSLGCDPEVPASNGCSPADVLRNLREQFEDCFDFAHAVKL